MTAELLGNAVVAGILLGGFYAAVALGLAIVFGQLDIVNIAHPAFIVVGAYVAYILNSKFGLDPVLVGIGAAPVPAVVPEPVACARAASRWVLPTPKPPSR